MGWFKNQWKELRSHAKWEVVRVVGALMFAGAYPLLQKFRHLEWDWWVFGGLFVVSFVLLIISGRRGRPNQMHSQSAQDSSAFFPAVSTLVPGSPAPNFDAGTFFKHAYYSPLTAEVEKNIRLIADHNQPNDRDGFMAKFIGVGLMAYLHDITWFTIFKSQFLMLLDMNAKNGRLRLADAKVCYDKAAVEYPQIYSRYSFEQWMAYMAEQQLLLRYPSDMLEITFRGKDFLKYSTHWGRYPEGRVG
jgi:hypothetical protein